MDFFNITEADLILKGAIFTSGEIANQPKVWLKTYQKLASEKDEISSFWNRAIQKSKKIILTGAGTSAYIGQSLEGSFLKHTGITCMAIPTTHLVTHASDFLTKEEPILLVSFARSGNSPESVAAVKLVDQLCDYCIHLIITCDQEGQLAKYKSKNEKYTFVLPRESNDKSLAMTSSYTGMLLTGLLFSRFEMIGSLLDQVVTLAEYGSRIITHYGETLKEFAKTDFNRAVVLGSGPLYGTASESALKLQELTDGYIICKNDSFLAFRHGPKAVIDEKTIVIFLFSNRESVLRYEKDFVLSLNKGKKAMALLGVSENSQAGLNLDVDIFFSDSPKLLDEDFLPVCSILPAQILGLFKSMELGLKPDNPSVSGAISRVVEGVIIYDK
jgi:tagatose-6-phosphate ketose/aldose isomerase